MYPPPSNACGGFHLLVVNNDAYAVDVDINGTDAGTVEPSSQTMLVQFFQPELPPFPWVVEVSRAADGAWVGTAELDSGVADTKITVSGGQINVMNFDLASTGCDGLDSGGGLGFAVVAAQALDPTRFAGCANARMWRTCVLGHRQWKPN